MKHSNGSSELETGISELDLDNRSLLASIERVIACSEDGNRAGLKSSFLMLQAETTARFGREERLMRACHYQATESHLAEHRQLSAVIAQQIHELDAGTVNSAVIGRFMHNQLLRHLRSQDPLLGQAIRSQSGTTDRRLAQDDTEAPYEALDIFEERRLGNIEPIVWTSAMELGVEAIDTEHRAMIAVFNAILLASQAADKTGLARLLDQLGNNIADHFEHEERLMAAVNYEHAAAHQEEHRQLLEEYAHQIDDWRERHISAELLCRFMYRWLLRHTMTSDGPLSEAIIQHATGAPA